MTARWMVAALLAAATGAGVTAAEGPQYRPVPDWVKPAPPVDAMPTGDDAPLLMVLDQQQLMKDGEVWSYQDIATRLATPEIVAQGGTVSIPWHPAKGDLIVHRVEIIRGGRHIDALAGDRKFQVLRREQQLERLTLDGMLTATLAVEGLQVGDVLHVTASTTNREAVFGPAMQAMAALPMLPAKVGFVRARMLWPAAADVRWRRYAEGPAPVVATLPGGMHELTLTGPLAKPDDLPDDAPVRFRKLPFVEASSFGGWEAVSKTMAPLYATTGLIAPGGELAAEVDRIRTAQPDALHRVAAALQLVQDKIRYLANGMGNGNYQPQTPVQTWTLRYGDCKAKTLLLLSLLHALGIEAEPVLASSQLGDMLPDRLPAAGAFDHVLVRATVDGKALWLDGTGNGARFADLDDAPAFRHVLPVRAAGAGLIDVPLVSPARPGLATVVEIDQRAGVTMPALVKGVFTLRGPFAAMIDLARTQGSKEQVDGMVSGMMQTAVGGQVSLVDRKIVYDSAVGEATITASGIMGSMWREEDGRWRLNLDHGVGDIGFDPDRARVAWATIPVSTGEPQTTAFRTRLRLPDGGLGFALDGDQKQVDPLPGTVIRRSAAIADGAITVDERTERTGMEIAPAALGAARSRRSQAQSRLLTAIAPTDLPARWQTVQAARRDGRFKPLLAAYAAAIAADPKERSGYLNRAIFLSGVYEWTSALPDFDRAIALENDRDARWRRAFVLTQLGQDDKAAVDYRAIMEMDPTDEGAQRALATYDADHGHRAEAVARVQERIDRGGKERGWAYQQMADLQVRLGERDAALAAIDKAVAVKPNDAWLLNSRCWVKAQLNVALDTAMKDCTRSIELGERPSAALDSRALVFFRQGRLDEALADLAAALELEPARANSLYLRSLIHRRRGETAAAKTDLEAAQLIEPRVAEDYTRVGIVG